MTPIPNTRQDGQAPSPRAASARGAGFRVFASAIAALVAAALVARAMWGDRWLITELALLVPLTAVVIVGVASALLGRGSWRVRGGGVLLLLALAFPGYVIEHPRLLAPSRLMAAPANQDEPLRVVAWNVMSYNWAGKRGAGIVEALAADDPDIVCLTEGTYRRQAPDFVQRAMGRDWEWAATRQLLVGSRYPIASSRELATRSRLRVFEATIAAPGGDVRVLLADLPTPPRRDTAAMFTELRAILELTPQPFLLVGDFNTPRGSWHMARATEQLTDLHAAAGADRWLASWPSPFPLWQIDHAFASPQWQPIRAELRGSVQSDHRRQYLVVQRRPGA